MKKLLAFIPLFLFVVVCAVASNYANTVFHTTMNVAMAAPVVLSTQKIVFMTSLQEEYKKLDTWINEVQDLSSFVEGGQTLKFPEGGSFPAVYKNRTTDIDSVEPTESIYDVSLNYYDSQNFKMRNINMHALPYDKISFYTEKSAKAIKLNEINDAAYQLAPDSASTQYKRIVIGSTGTARNGFKMLQLSDILTLARAMDNLEFPKDGRNIVLPSDLWWDLVQNNDVLKGQLQYQQQNGIINPTIVAYYGIKIHRATTNSLVAYNVQTNIKAAQGALITGNVVPAGFVFCASECFRAGGSFDMYMLNKENNTAGRADEFGFSHRFSADFTKSNQRYSGLVYLSLSA